MGSYRVGKAGQNKWGVNPTQIYWFIFLRFHQMSGALIKQINQRIKDDGGVEDVIELNLSDLKMTTISAEVKKVLDRAKNVEVVLLSDNELDNLDNLPDWKLTAFDLSNNKYAPSHPD